MQPSGPRRLSRTVLTLRIALLACLLAATTGPAWPGPARARPPRVVLDVSESMGTSGEGSPPPAFAHPDRLVFADGLRLAVRGEDLSGLPRGRTRLRDALGQAAELLGAEPGVLWLVTDGRDTEGGAIEAARDLARKGHRLFVGAPSPARADVGLVSARLDSAAKDAPVVVRARVAASVGGRARVTLRRATVTADAVEATLAPGVPAEVVLRDAQPLRETTVYEVALVPLDGTPDDDRENDALGIVASTGDPLVVVVDAEPWGPLPGAPRLRFVAGLDPAATDVADLVVVSDVPWRRMRDGGADRLARLVAGGATLLVLGGPDAFGPGGWRGSAFERLLPLQCPREEADDTTLVVAVDHSGSTGETPAGGGPTALQALVRALGGLVEALPPGVRVAVLPFAAAPDGGPLPPGWLRGGDQVAGADLTRSAKAMSAAGGTDLDRAVAAAAATAAAGPASRRRRVLLLTDGDPDHTLTPAALGRARDALRAAGADFGAVVRGDPKAAEALRSLASAPEDVALIDAVGDFPDALLATFLRGQAREEWIEGALVVRVRDGHPELSGLAGLAPSRAHRVEVAPGAEVLATAVAPSAASGAPSEVPFVARRAFGAGRVVAVAGGPALEAGAGREAFRAALAPLLARLAGEADRGLLGDEEDGRLVVRAPPGLGSLRVLGTEAGLLSLLIESGPGVYEGPRPVSVPADEPLLVEAQGLARRPVRMPVRPPVEHRGVGVDEAMLRALAVAGGGARLPVGAEPPGATERASIPLAPWILLASLVLFLLERAASSARPPWARSGRGAAALP